MSWMDYVREHGGDEYTAIGRRLGVSGATVSRWQTSAPKPENVRQFAEAYGRPVLEAFVAAGFLTGDQAAEQVVRADVGSLSDQELADEVLARMTGARSAASQQRTEETGSKSRGPRAQGAPIVPLRRAAKRGRKPDERPSPGD